MKKRSKSFWAIVTLSVMLFSSIAFIFFEFYAFRQLQLFSYSADLTNHNFYAVKIQNALDKLDDGDLDYVHNMLEALKNSHVGIVELMRDSENYTEQVNYAAGVALQWIEANQIGATLERKSSFSEPQVLEGPPNLGQREATKLITDQIYLFREDAAIELVESGIHFDRYHVLLQSLGFEQTKLAAILLRTWTRKKLEEESQNYSGTPLRTLVSDGPYESVSLLLDTGFVYGQEELVYSLEVALKSGFLDIARRLWSELDTLTTEEAQKILAAAAFGGSYSFVKKITEETGLDVNFYIDGYGHSQPRHILWRTIHRDRLFGSWIFRYLVSQGADVCAWVSEGGKNGLKTANIRTDPWAGTKFEQSRQECS